MTSLQELLGCDDLQWKVANLFHSASFARVTHALENKTRFVHYTNAETAMKLFKHKEVWLRKSTHMNDFMEVQHGLDCLSAAYKKHKGTFGEKFEAIFPNICKRIEDYFDDWLPTYRNGTYLSCVSEHNDSPDRNEDRMGRLSMWRAYGGAAGVAIVMNGDVFHTPVSSDALKAYTSPVEYHSIVSFDDAFSAFVSGLLQNMDLLQALGEEDFLARMIHAFRYATLCTKHPGFFEEKEWRIIYSPAVEKSEIITESVESIGGIPQKVCKLPLVDRPELGIVGLALDKLINRVIIGPCVYPYEVFEALSHLLEQQGVEDAKSRVFVSDIPLRQVS